MHLSALRRAGAAAALAAVFCTNTLAGQTQTLTSVANSPDSTRTALAEELLTLMQVGPVMLAAMEDEIAQQKAEDSELPEAFWTEFIEAAERGLPTFIREQLVPVYASRFNEEELTELVAFYRTPTGLRLAREQNDIMNEVKYEAKRWGMELSFTVLRTLAERGEFPD